jgi:hypothetical protein
MKTLGIIADMHSGSIFGITPPEYWSPDDDRRAMQEEGWNAYCKIAKDFGELDYLLINGDCTEGNAKKDGGAELISPDRNLQCVMAIDAIKQFTAKRRLMTYGTAYHVSEGAEDFEFIIARELGADIGGRLFFEIEGMVFDARHKVGSSSVPYSRSTASAKEITWNMLRESNDTGPRVDCVIRSHVHYHTYIEVGDRIAMTTPCLQLARGRFGSRQCTGEIHWGAIKLTIDNGKIINREVVLCRLQSNRPRLMKIG